MTGEELRKYLKDKRLSGKKILLIDLAHKLNMTAQALNSKLNNKTLDISFVKNVADFLNMSVEELTLDATGRMQPNNISEPTSEYGETIEQKYLKCLEQRNKDQQLIIQLQRQLLERK